MDGRTIEPLDAIRKASGLLSAQFKSVSEISFEDKAKDTDGDPIETLSFSSRTLNELKANGIHTAGDLRGARRADIEEMRGIGGMAIKELDAALKS